MGASEEMKRVRQGSRHEPEPHQRAGHDAGGPRGRAAGAGGGLGEFDQRMQADATEVARALETLAELVGRAVQTATGEPVSGWQGRETPRIRASERNDQ